MEDFNCSLPISSIYQLCKHEGWEIFVIGEYFFRGGIFHLTKAFVEAFLLDLI